MPDEAKPGLDVGRDRRGVPAVEPDSGNPHESRPQLRDTLGRLVRRIAFSLFLSKPASPTQGLD